MTGIELFAWLALIFLIIIGMLGVILPGLPGAALILLGVVVHKILLPDVFSQTAVWIVAVLVFSTFVVDFVSFVIGAKWGGASKNGVWGAAVGGLLGMAFAPIGLLLGPVLGAFVGELIGLRSIEHSARSGFFAGLGMLVGVVVRLALSGLSVLVIIIDLLM